MFTCSHISGVEDIDLLVTVPLVHFTLKVIDNIMMVRSKEIVEMLRLNVTKNNVHQMLTVEAPRHCTDLNITFLSPGRLSGRNDVTLDKVNFKQDIRQNFFWEKNQNVKSLRSS